MIPQIANNNIISDNVRAEPSRQEKRYKLEDDPMCGLTTGGREDCYWDCNIITDRYYRKLVTNPECLLDCYSKVEHSFIFMMDFKNALDR